MKNKYENIKINKQMLCECLDKLQFAEKHNDVYRTMGTWASLIKARGAWDAMATGFALQCINDTSVE
ncbi:MAG TPA: hypothetical protein ENJ28_04820 [Gammaproteobacteria bacterium]|nr:hypothetical protein [Gammaproteobacteria bacterium]